MRRVWVWMGLLLALATVGGTESFSRVGRDLCSVELRSRVVSYLSSHIQPVYQPYLALCQGNRLCSTYRTTYKVTHRQAYRKISQPTYACPPGWRQSRAFWRPGWSAASSCQPPCRHEGKRWSLSDCACPSGWSCQKDVDGCAGGRHKCSQLCFNLPGSYRCACQPGYELQADGRTCRPLEGPPAPTPPAGGDSLTVQDEVKELKSRLTALEDRFRLTLMPWLKLDLPGRKEGPGTDPAGLIVHVLQQLDRIDSLSEQISFLEEKLESCSCKDGR